MISGSKQYIANSAAQVGSTGGNWTQVIAPTSNTAGIYISALAIIAGTGGAADWRFHTDLPSGGYGSGVGLASLSSTSGSIYPVRLDNIDVIVPPGQGIYVASASAPTAIFYRIL